MAKEKFVLIDESRLFSMAGLSNSSKWLYTLLLLKIDRVYNHEPKKDTNIFLLKYKDFEMFGIPRKSFARDIKELIEKSYIEISGARQKRVCKILKW